MGPWAARVFVAAALAALAFVPAGQGNVIVDSPGVATNLLMYVPQVQCTIVFTEPGEQICKVEGKAWDATTVRARVVGDATVHAFVNKIVPGSPDLQVALIDCVGPAASCIEPFFYGRDSGTFRIFVDAEGAPGAIVSVDIERPPNLPLP